MAVGCWALSCFLLTWQCSPCALLEVLHSTLMICARFWDDACSKAGRCHLHFYRMQADFEIGLFAVVDG